MRLTRWIPLVLFLSAFAFASVAFADDGGSSDASSNASDLHLRSGSHEGGASSPTLIPHPQSLVAGTYSQAIDHLGALAGQTFSQRYWVDSEYASSSDTAPVILHICGEGDAEQGYFLHDNAIAWAKALGAHLVYLEHRYYGQSLPFSDLSSPHLTYLTLDNVVEDLADFQKWITQTQGWKGKWVSVGGSYSGTLSAIYRFRHPELVSGALAASAPMKSGVGESEGTQEDVDSLSSTDPSDDTGGRQWVYQSCTTFGFWETDGTTLFEPSSWLCQQLFGNVGLVNSQAYNQKYDLPFMSASAQAPSNILFTYGSADMWTAIGVTSQANKNPGITIHTIAGAGHHFDLNFPTASDTAAVIEARNVFLGMAKSWLGFGP